MINELLTLDGTGWLDYDRRLGEEGFTHRKESLPPTSEVHPAFLPLTIRYQQNPFFRGTSGGLTEIKGVKRKYMQFV